ncbi:MAG: cytochrome P450 [Gammaproteobacteria bacterium]|nr:cytochrome P450 [Gammaproteobacteria bacterium]
MAAAPDAEPLREGVALTARDPVFRADPDACYDQLRARAALYRDAAYGRYLVTRYEDGRQVLRQREFSVDARQSHPDSYLRRLAGTGVAPGVGASAYEPPLVLLDDPAHRRIRLLMSKAFTPRAVAAMRPRIELITRQQLAALEGASEIDFIERYAGPLPTRIIAEMMGLPAADCADLKRWSDAILQGYDPARDAATQSLLRDSYLAMSGLFRDTLTARRRAPREDLISAMVRAQESRDRLSDLEIISLCTQLLVAGNVTTTDLMGNGLHALLQHPEQLLKLRARPALMAQAVDEMLRYDCPLTETGRVALTATRVGGCPVAHGDTLTVALAAANHDAAQFPQPHVFDIERDATAHLAFGSGPHVCLGAPLARLEGEICLQAFIARYPSLRAGSVPPTRRELPFFRGFARLPVRLV